MLGEVILVCFLFGQLHSSNVLKFRQKETVLLKGVTLECIPTSICRCFTIDYDLIMDCSDRDIDAFPVIPWNTTVLYLQNNSITTIGENDTREMSSLLYLDLRQNKLVYDNVSFHQMSFVNLQSLQYLDLSMNNFQYQDAKYPPSVTIIPSLEYLILDGVDQDGFGSEYTRLKNLTFIDLSTRCNINHMRSDYFQNTTKLRTLDISNCNIRSIEIGTFMGLYYLTVLNISYNDRLTFAVLPNITSDLRYTSIDELDVSKLHCTYGVGIFVYYEDLFRLRDTNLTKLHINSNRISVFEVGTFAASPKTLKHVMIRDNRLTLGKFYVELVLMNSLESFDSSFQYTSHDPSKNLFNMDCNDWRSPPAKLKPSPYMLEYLKHYNEMPTGAPFPIPPNIKVMKFAKSTLRYDVIPKLDFGPNRLTHFELQDNSLATWVGPIESVEDLEYVDLSGNSCRYVSTKFFSNFISLKNLVISNNNIGLNMENDVNGDIFNTLQNLTTLDLSTNRIESTPKLLLKNQNKLTYLSLKNNSLDNFQLQISHMENLVILNLSYNKIAALSTYQRQQILSISNGILKIDMRNNAFVCNCFTRGFIRWFGENLQFFKNPEMYKCTYHDMGTRNLINYRAILNQLDADCRKNDMRLILPLAFGVPFLLISISAVIAYKYWFRIIYKYYTFGNRHKRNNGELKYDYGVNLIYCDEEIFEAGRFVISLERVHNEHGVQYGHNNVPDQNTYEVINAEDMKLLPLHERQREQFLFFEHRDNAHNAHKDWSYEEYIDMISRSKKTVILLTDTFLTNDKTRKYLKVILTFCTRDMIENRNGKPNAIIIKFDGVKLKMLPWNLIDEESTTVLPFVEDTAFFLTLIRKIYS